MKLPEGIQHTDLSVLSIIYTIYIRVSIDKPHMKRIEQEIRFGYIKGYVNLTCEADAEPPAEFIWYRDGKKVFHNVHNGPHISILQVSILISFLMPFLTFLLSMFHPSLFIHFFFSIS